LHIDTTRQSPEESATMIVHALVARGIVHLP
jgi:hypothetical protein